MTALIAAVALLIGIQAGYYARTMRDMLKRLHDYWKDRLETPAGVVRPVGRPLTPNEPVGPTSETGGVMRATPEQYMIDSAKERDRQLRGY